LTSASSKSAHPNSFSSPVVKGREQFDDRAMGPKRVKGRGGKKSREAEMQKVREEIADLQRKLKEMIERRNGNGKGKDER
jgi:hypothetical protein